jgi:hypothetical protein
MIAEVLQPTFDRRQIDVARSGPSIVINTGLENWPVLFL